MENKHLCKLQIIKFGQAVPEIIESKCLILSNKQDKCLLQDP